jgi:hypothetical protein
MSSCSGPSAAAASWGLSSLAAEAADVGSTPSEPVAGCGASVAALRGSVPGSQWLRGPGLQATQDAGSVSVSSAAAASAAAPAAALRARSAPSQMNRLASAVAASSCLEVERGQAGGLWSGWAGKEVAGGSGQARLTGSGRA